MDYNSPTSPGTVSGAWLVIVAVYVAAVICERTAMDHRRPGLQAHVRRICMNMIFAGFSGRKKKSFATVYIINMSCSFI
jgi:hypothetical protein